MTDVAKLSSLLLPNRLGVRSIRDLGANGTYAQDATAAFQAAWTTGGWWTVPPGDYRITVPFAPKNNTRFIGPTRGLRARIYVQYSGSEYPIQLDGVNGDGTWLSEVDLENLFFDMEQWTGTATHAMNINGVFACTLDRVTLQTVPAAKRAVRIGRLNHTVLDTFRIYTPLSAPVVGFDCRGDSDGPINGLILRNCNPEVLQTGVLCEGNTHPVSIDIIEHYGEATDIFVDWNAGHVESRLTVNGGTLIAPANSTGVKIRRSNCTVNGLAVTGAPLYGVDIDGATSSANCHVIGGNLRGTPVRDTANLLATNTWRASAQTYACTWTSSTPPAIGNGNLYSAYSLAGKMCTVTVRLVPGSTTTYGTGNWTFSLPIAAVGLSNQQWTGSAMALDSGTGYRVGTVLVSATGTTAAVFFDSAGNEANATTPFTWANGDSLNFTITYPVA